MGVGYLPTQVKRRSRQWHILELAAIFDGILANFSVGYAAILTKLTGVEFPDYSKEHPKVWYWERAAGVEKNRENIAWEEIKADTTFWLNLPAHEGADEFLFGLKTYLDADDDIYFITNRMGLNVKWQTETWLKYHGYDRPTVLISKEKAECCKALALTHYIDDKQENVVDCVKNSPQTKTFMLAMPYNNEVAGAKRITSLLEFLDEITRKIP